MTREKGKVRFPHWMTGDEPELPDRLTVIAHLTDWRNNRERMGLGTGVLDDALTLLKEDKDDKETLQDLRGGPGTPGAGMPPVRGG